MDHPLFHFNERCGELDDVYASAEKALARVTLGQLLRSTSEIVPLCEVGSMKK